jgi:hypothetical protein
MTYTSPECGAEHETIDDFETDSVKEIEAGEDGGLSLHEKTTCSSARAAASRWGSVVRGEAVGVHLRDVVRRKLGSVSPERTG